MRARGIAYIAALLLGLGLPALAAERAVAVTIDDLPYTHAYRDDYVKRGKPVVKALLRVLNERRVPVVGFVTEGRLQKAGDTDARVTLLKQWADAGVILGNHTLSHPSLTAASVEDYQDDIVRGDIITRRLMKDRPPYTLYFRHPFTHTGNTKEKKEAIEAFLAARGYKVTPHTIENADYMFNLVYVDAKERRDRATARDVREAYVAFTAARTEFAEAISLRVFGREIPQTLLLHANEINADALEALLALYEARGYRFITLDEAMADPAYQTPDTLVTPHGPTWLWRWSRSLGQDVSFRGDPDPPDWVTTAYGMLRTDPRFGPLR